MIWTKAIMTLEHEKKTTSKTLFLLEFCKSSTIGQILYNKDSQIIFAKSISL